MLRKVQKLIVTLVMLILIIPQGLLYSQSEKVVSANYEAAHRFSQENIKKMVYDMNVRPNWLNSSEKFWYKWENSSGASFYIVDPAGKSKRPVFDNETMAMKLTEILNRPFNSKELGIEEIEFVNNNRAILFDIDTVRFQFELASGNLVKIEKSEKPRKPGWMSFSPDSLTIVFARDHNLFMMNANDPDSTEFRLTSDGELFYSYAADDSDTSKTERKRAGISWFRDSKKFYSQRSDSRETKDFYLVDALTEPRPTLQTYKYTLPGEENIVITELNVFDRESKNQVKVKADKWNEQYIGGVYTRGIYTGKTSSTLYFLRMDRTFSKIDLCAADTETGDVKVLINEISEPYFNLHYANLSILNEGTEFIWWSERDGWGHYYLYDSEGNLKNRITSGPYTCRGIASIDTLNRTLYFQSSSRIESANPLYAHLYKVKFDGSGLQHLTPENATHNVEFSESSRYFIDNFSRVDMVPESVLKDSRGNRIIELERSDVSALEEAGWQPPEMFTVKAADGKSDIYGTMYKPFDLDPAKKYPIVVYLYPGPQSEAQHLVFSPMDHINTGLAQIGCIVVTFGNRGGTPEMSKWYHNYGYGNLRDYGLADKKAGVEQLANRYSFIDIERVGTTGASGGGFQSSAFILTYPGFVDVAVSWAGNHDNNIYNHVWSELHHGVKEVKNEDGTSSFESHIPTNQELAKNLEGNLLLMHGLRDNNVHPANTLRLAQALIEANKAFDMLLLPDEQHRFSRSKYQPYLLRVVWNYFGQHLIGDPMTRQEMFLKFKGDVLAAPYDFNK